MNYKTLIIAEAGVNHNGDINKAYQLIDVAAEAGADIVKFQSFKANKLASKSVKKAEYQINNMQETNLQQYDMLKKLELNEEAHFLLKNYCNEKKIEFLSTPFDVDSLNFLVEKIKINSIKIGSGEITNYPFLLNVAKKNLPIILSTGMSCLGDIELALGVIAFGFLNKNIEPSKKVFLDSYFSEEGQLLLKKQVTLLHCTTEYPAPFEEVNLKSLDTLKNAFDLNVGFSDHTRGIAVPIAAVALGACLIEKHFTLDKDMEGPDHKASLDPVELKNMIIGIRQIEKALGQTRKVPSLSEYKNRNIARRVVVAETAITAGELFTEKNISIKRAGEGLSPLEYWNLIGKKAKNNFQPDETITIE